MQNSDIETARKLLGHSTIMQTQTYVHPDQKRLREAARKRDKIYYDTEIEIMFAEIKSGKVEKSEFVQKIKKLFNV